MHYRLRTLLNWLTWVLTFGWYCPIGRCAYCGKSDKYLYGSTGPLGNSVRDVCYECSQSCISLIE